MPRADPLNRLFSPNTLPQNVPMASDSQKLIAVTSNARSFQCRARSLR